MGTGSEPPQMLRLRKNAAGSVPVPFFHAKKGTGTVGNTNYHCHTGHRRSQSPFSRTASGSKSADKSARATTQVARYNIDHGHLANSPNPGTLGSLAKLPRMSSRLTGTEATPTKSVDVPNWVPLIVAPKL